ncbi:hypothetical protein AaE_005778 [Aphanomyces astaci]|uniref:FYVE-type domain-containing protein n=1 Tax=Aphanomyces astaci TaxID=112090 RepID=A0A6A5ALL9_APHAT|nr:hypothetical protein AaE_005778 [Aphanomyces astaci]
MDAKVVRVFEAASADDSFKFSGVKYIKTQMPVQSTHVSRDAVYFEYSGCRALPNGGRYLFVVQDAIQSKQVPPQTNVARESITIVYLFNELPGGRVQFSMESSVLPVGVIPTWFTAYSYWQTMARLECLPEVRSIVSARHFNVAWVPDSARKHCIVCTKRFSPLRSRHHCRSCGDIMCAACTVRIAYTPLFLQSEPSQKAMQERKICAQCIRVTKESLSAKYPLHAIKLPSQSTNISCPDEHNTLNEGDISKVNHRLGGISTSDTTATTKNDSPPPRQCVSMDEGNCQHEHDYLDNPFQSMALTRPTAARYRRKTPGPTSEGFIVCQFNGSDLETIHTTENGLTLSIAHQH